MEICSTWIGQSLTIIENMGADYLANWGCREKRRMLVEFNSPLTEGNY